MTLMENNKYEEYEATLAIGYCREHGQKEFVTDASAWRTATKGLIVNRPLIYKPVEGVHCLRLLWHAGERDDNWTVTHRRSGYSLLLPTEVFTRQKEAFKFAKRMGKHATWTFPDTTTYNGNAEIYAALVSSRQGVLNELSSEMKGIVVYDEDFDPPFVIQVERTEGGRLFHVMNKESGDTAATFPHRGLAVEKAVELNLAEMV